MNITEDYVSFEVAKLLKEKGFHEPCIATYNSTTKNFQVEEIYEDWTIHWKDYISAPTHQMAMKWLREKKIFINIWYDKTDFSAEYVNGYFNYIGNFDSYEEAVEQSIKYVLEHVI